MDRNKSIIPSIGYNMRLCFEYELGLLKFEKDEEKRRVIEEYLRMRVKELKEKFK